MRRAISGDWSIDLDGDYDRTVVDGHLRFMIPGRTIWITVWRKPGAEMTDTLSRIRTEARNSHPLDAEEFEEIDSAEARYASWYREPATNGIQYSLYGYTIRPDSYVQSALISDFPEDREWALKTWRSLRHGGIEPKAHDSAEAGDPLRRKRAPETGRAAARAAIAAFGGEPEIYSYARDEDERDKVDILSCKDRPNPGLVSYSTLGVHLVPNLLDNDDFRVELAGIAESTVENFPNLMAMAAFYVLRNRWHVAKGIVFPGLVSECKLSMTMEHLMWVEPLEWDALQSVDVGEGLTVHWVLGFPISESERQYLTDNGFWKLEALMVDREVDYWDVNRRPVV